MIKLWILSDLHCEMLGYPHRINLPRPKCDMLVMAGDFHRAGRVVGGMRAVFGERIPIVFVAGNHEHYQSKLTVREGIDRLYQDALTDREAGRVTHFLENDSVEMEIRGEAIRLIGATLWTDLGLFGTKQVSEEVAKRRMNDYALIKSNDPSIWELRPQETAAWHRESRAYIERQLRTPFPGRTVVVTHHLPSLRSVPPRFQSDPLSPAYASRCDDLLELGADLWIHGHTHDSCDYQADNTRVVCNPRGYETNFGRGRAMENPKFQPGLVVRVGEKAPGCRG